MVVTYANYLAEKEHQISIWANHIDTVFELSPLVKIKKIPLKTKIGTILTAILEKFDSHIIIADIAVLATLLSLKNQHEVVYFAQDNDIYYYKNRLMQNFINFVYKLSLGKLNIPCIAVSDNLAEELSKYTHNIQVVPNGIDLSKFHHDPDENFLQLKGEKKSILVFGRTDYRKGLDIAIRVINKLTDMFSEEEMEIWVVGNLIPENIFPYILRNFGYVNEKKLRRILSSSDLFLYPSRHEGLPLFILQALACGCPIVTTKAVKIVNHLEQAWVSEVEDVDGLKDGIVYFLSNIQSTRSFTEKAGGFVRNYDLSLTKNRFEHLLKAIVT